MRRVVMAALIAALVTTATVGTGAAQDRPEGGLNRERGITEARSHTGGAGGLREDHLHRHHRHGSAPARRRRLRQNQRESRAGPRTREASGVHLVRR
jgi:hypothetical protein